MKIVKLIGEIELLSGLHIGGGDDTMKIGGIDNQVIKDINSDKPYIPGSSLKGKMRSLLELHHRLVHLPSAKGEPFKPSLLKEVPEDEKQNAINIIKLFGASGDEAEKFGITRINVGDCFLSEESTQKKLSEAKYENVIDRKSGTAKHPRQTERVPAGVKFNYDIRIKVLDEDDENELVNLVKQGLSLIEDDYLGGNGSRGYGRVEFSNKNEWKE
jgi:CRISPR-associated protein Csm3